MKLSLEPATREMQINRSDKYIVCILGSNSYDSVTTSVDVDVIVSECKYRYSTLYTFSSVP